MLKFADGIGAGDLDLGEGTRRFVEPLEKIPDRAKKPLRPVTRLQTLIISNRCHVSEAL
jgi:hypothetical protein